MAFQLHLLVHDCITQHQRKSLGCSTFFLIEDDFAAPTQLIGNEAALKEIILLLLHVAVQTGAKRVRLSTRQLLQTQQKLVLEFCLQTEEKITNCPQKLFSSLMIKEAQQLIEKEGGKCDGFLITETEALSLKFILPYGWANVQPAKKQSQKWNGITVLLAEDNEINQKAVVHILHTAGVNVDTAINGKEAIELFEQKSYDVVLLDLRMPHMDGFEAAVFIRKHLHSTTPIIALTASGAPNEREFCLNLGMNEYITKPFAPEALLQTLAQCLCTKNKKRKKSGITKPAKHSLVENPPTPHRQHSAPASAAAGSLRR